MGKFNDLHNPIKTTDEMWESHLGTEVEDFITRKLELSNIVDIEYVNSMLRLVKENGDILEKEVSVIEPSYDYGIKIMGLEIDKKIYTDVKDNLTFQYKSGKTIRLGIAMYALITTSETKDRTGLFNVKINYGNRNTTLKISSLPYSKFNIQDGKIQDVNIPLEEVSWLDITELFKEYSNSQSIKATVIPRINEGDEQVSDVLGFNVTTEVIKINYTGKSIVNSNNIDFIVSGGTSGNYVLGGYFNSKEYIKLTNLLFNNLKPGLNKLIVQAVNVNDASITSDYLYLDVINTLGCTKTEIAVNNVNDNISNNGVSELYNLSVYSPNLEQVKITTYLEDLDPSGGNLTQIVKSEILSASDYDENNTKTTSYSKYIEISSSNAFKYLAISVNDELYKFVNVYNNPVSGKDVISETDYKTIQIDPINLELTYYSDYSTNYNFDLMNGYLNNIFVTSLYSNNPTVVDNLDVSDGWKEKDGITYFKVSARNSSLFNKPIPLNLLGNCSIELGFKTYNISDESKPILTVGDFLLRPTQFCWNDGSIIDEVKDTTFTARNAQFLENTKIHLLMTVHENYFIDKNDMYYPKYLLGSFLNNFDNSSKDTKWHLVRIYINGVIDREIELDLSELDKLKQAVLDIKPEGCDVDFYLLRIYNTQSLDFYQVQRNYISFLTNKLDKLKVFEANDITFTNGGEISFKKTLGKYNSLVYVYPKGGRFPNRAWGGANNEDPENPNEKRPTTLFINYADEQTNLKYGGRIINGLVKGLGSSAMRYLIWNVSYQLNKFTDADDNDIKSQFLPYSAMDTETNTFNADAASSTNAMLGYYKMPNYAGQEDTEQPEVTKLVGKVNFASSMQSHKVGACKLYDDAYKYTFKNEYKNMMYSGGKKAVHEEPYLYFYWESDLEDVSNVEFADLLANDSEIKFMGFQTWGAGKGDKAESGYNKKTTPGYLMLEGGENGEHTTNFRIPWQELQRASGGEIGTVDYKLGRYPVLSYEQSLEIPWSNLYINDESIVHIDRGAWDIDFGCHDDKNKFDIEKYPDLKDSIKQFREFYDFVYTYDYNLVESSAGNSDDWYKLIKGEDIKYYKIVSTNPNVIVNGVVPNNPKKGDVYRYDYVNEKWVPAGVSYNNGSWDKLNIYELTGDPTNLSVSVVKETIKALFAQGVLKYIDVNDIAFHLAFIKFVSGTDNRAKNTYFQIIGPLYEKNADTGKYEKTEKGDLKIRLIADDLDTIFLTDNAGLQSKSYNLLEPSYDETHIKYWGDSNNIFFYMFDLCFEEKIKDYLSSIIDKCFDKSESVEDKNNYFYTTFFNVQETLPSVAYNHTAKIYYETAHAILKSKALGDIYTNNEAAPLEQSHGSCLSCEKLFMNKRMDFLSGYALSSKIKGLMGTAPSGNSSLPILLRMEFEPYQDFYPNYKCEDGVVKYIGKYDNSDFIALNLLVKKGNTYVAEINDKAINQGIYQTHLYKSLNILGLTVSEFSGQLEKTTDFKIDNAELKNYEMFNNHPELSLSKFSASFPVLEKLTLRNVKLPNVMDLTQYLKLKEVDFTGSSVKQVILPQTDKLIKVTLSDSVEDFKIYNNVNLQEVNFAGVNNLKNVYIDCSKCGNFDVSNFCESLLNSSLDKITLINMNGISLSEEVFKFITSVSECLLTGSVNLVDSEGQLKDISVSTKKYLVNTFGNIKTGSNGLIINYKETDITAIQYPESVNAYYNELIGGELIFADLFNVTFNGNKVDIIEIEDGIYDLAIKYELITGESSIITVNQHTGELTLEGLPSSDATIKISITSEGNTYHNANKLTKVVFAWVAPKIGYFVYTDGTFSSNYHSNKQLIGLIYDKNGSDDEGELYVIGTEVSNSKEYCSYLSEDVYGISDNNLKNDVSLLINYIKQKNTNISSLIPSNLHTPTVINSIYRVGDGNPGNIIDTMESYGYEETKLYVDFVNSEILPILMKEYNLRGIEKYITQDNSSGEITYKIDSINNLNNVCDLLQNSQLISGLSNKYILTALVYPYFYSAWLYTVGSIDPNNFNGYTFDSNWYVPSVEDMTKIVFLYGYSVKLDAFTSNVPDAIFNNNVDKYNGTYSDKFVNSPVFALAMNKMGDSAYKDSWRGIFTKNNILTTNVDADHNCYGYVQQTQYKNGIYTTVSSWQAGMFNIYSTHSNMGTNSKLWAYTKRLGGIPCITITYKNPTK